MFNGSPLSDACNITERAFKFVIFMFCIDYRNKSVYDFMSLLYGKRSKN